MHSGFSTRAMFAAGLVAVVYSALAVVATDCVLSHAAHAGSHGHHDSHDATPNNALCAWACQARSDAALVAESPTLSTQQVVQLLAAFPQQTFPSFSASPLHSRAPPSVPFVYIG